MADRRKREIVEDITELLKELIEQDENTAGAAEEKKETEPLEMLTVKECAEQIKGLAENTVRQLVKQDKLPHIRSGRGERERVHRAVPGEGINTFIRRSGPDSPHRQCRGDGRSS